MKRITMSIASTTAALLCLAGCAGANKAAQPAPAPLAQAATEVKDAVQLVNGVAITRAEIERATRVLLSQSGAPQQLPPDAMQKASQAALDQLTMAELLYQEAAKIEIKDLDQQVEKKIAESKALYPNPDAFEEALKGSGLTVAEMTRNARKSIMINAFIEERFASKVEVSDAEAQKFYQENQEKYFTRPENARASHILVKVDDKLTAEQKQQAKEKAEALLKRVKGGEDFAAVAKTESGCPSATVGGDLGTFGRGQMVPAFETAAFALKPGEVSGVVETQFGYHIIKLTEKQEAGTEKFEAVKDKITDFLKRQKVQQQLSDLIVNLRGTAKIETL